MLNASRSREKQFTTEAERTQRTPRILRTDFISRGVLRNFTLYPTSFCIRFILHAGTPRGHAADARFHTAPPPRPRKHSATVLFRASGSKPGSRTFVLPDRAGLCLLRPEPVRNPCCSR